MEPFIMTLVFYAAATNSASLGTGYVQLILHNEANEVLFSTSTAGNFSEEVRFFQFQRKNSLMARNENVQEVLNDLIRINNDRIEGYERAVDDTKDNDTDLQSIFHRMADESKQYASELESEVRKFGGNAAADTTVSGKIYRVWMDLKSKVTGNSRKSILESCEYGEDAAQKAYEEALKSDTELPSDLRQLIVSQKAALKTSHDTIKRYRDMHEGRSAE